MASTSGGQRLSNIRQRIRALLEPAGAKLVSWPVRQHKGLTSVGVLIALLQNTSGLDLWPMPTWAFGVGYGLYAVGRAVRYRILPSVSDGPSLNLHEPADGWTAWGSNGRRIQGWLDRHQNALAQVLACLLSAGLTLVLVETGLAAARARVDHDRTLLWLLFSLPVVMVSLRRRARLRYMLAGLSLAVAFIFAAEFGPLVLADYVRTHQVPAWALTAAVQVNWDPLESSLRHGFMLVLVTSAIVFVALLLRAFWRALRTLCDIATGVDLSHLPSTERSPDWSQVNDDYKVAQAMVGLLARNLWLGTVLLVEKYRGDSEHDLVCVAAAGDNWKALFNQQLAYDEAFRAAHLRPDGKPRAGMFHRVFEEGVPYCTDDATRDHQDSFLPIVNAEPKTHRRVEIRSEISVPVIVDETTIAVLTAHNPRPHVYWSIHRYTLEIAARMIGEHLGKVRAQKPIRKLADTARRRLAEARTIDEVLRALGKIAQWPVIGASEALVFAVNHDGLVSGWMTTAPNAQPLTPPKPEQLTPDDPLLHFIHSGKLAEWTAFVRRQGDGKDPKRAAELKTARESTATAGMARARATLRLSYSVLPSQDGETIKETSGVAYFYFDRSEHHSFLPIEQAVLCEIADAAGEALQRAAPSSTIEVSDGSLVRKPKCAALAYTIARLAVEINPAEITDEHLAREIYFEADRNSLANIAKYRGRIVEAAKEDGISWCDTTNAAIAKYWTTRYAGSRTEDDTRRDLRRQQEDADERRLQSAR